MEMGDYKFNFLINSRNFNDNSFTLMFNEFLPVNSRVDSKSRDPISSSRRALLPDEPVGSVWNSQLNEAYRFILWEPFQLVFQCGNREKERKEKEREKEFAKVRIFSGRRANIGAAVAFVDTRHCHRSFCVVVPLLCVLLYRNGTSGDRLTNEESC